MTHTIHRIVTIVASASVASVLAIASTGASAQLRVGGGGVDVVGPANATAATAPDPATTIVRDTRRSGGQTLRCWQHGRLLYEGAGFRGAVAGSNSISVQRRNGDGEAVTVMNLANGICILAD